MVKNIEINGFGINEFKEVTPIMKDLLKSYVQKSNDIELVDWVKTQLGEHLPDSKLDMVDQISADIISKIDTFNNNMMDMEQYCSQGKTRQEWFYNRIKENLEGTDINAYGNYLSQIENGLTVGNQIIIDALQSNNGGTIKLNDVSSNEISNIESNTDWNKYTLRNVASNIVEQANLAGIGNIAMPVGMDLALQATQMMDLPKSNIDLEKIELNSAVDNGIKTVATMALEIGLAKGKLPFLRKFIPSGVAADIACLGVESVKAIKNFTNGQASAMQTVEHLGRATTSAIVGFITNKATITMCRAIPVIGPYVGIALGTLAMTMSEQQIKQCIYMGIQKLQPIAVNMLNTARNIVTSGVNLVKNAGNKIASFLGF